MNIDDHISFDTNHYSVPHNQVHELVEVRDRSLPPSGREVDSEKPHTASIAAFLSDMPGVLGTPTAGRTH